MLAPLRERAEYIIDTTNLPSAKPVSYTHLDVYKRQTWATLPPLLPLMCTAMCRSA